MESHARKVESFYSTGLKKESSQLFDADHYDDGFLSFGYWDLGGRETYLAGANRLLDFFITNSEIKEADRILNVACGNGPETFAYFKRFKPRRIDGVDATQIHVDRANARAKAMKLDDKIIFHHGDACNLNFPKNTFSYVLGIEGPAHFNTRETFFKSAYNVLKKDGKMILTDIILGKRFDHGKFLHRLFMNIVTHFWVAPKANMIKQEQYENQLAIAGFRNINIDDIGDKVFPGYARNSFTWRTFKIRMDQRGLFTTLGLTVISYLLGVVYKAGLIEYVYVKAQK